METIEAPDPWGGTTTTSGCPYCFTLSHALSFNEPHTEDACRRIVAKNAALAAQQSFRITSVLRSI